MAIKRPPEALFHHPCTSVMAAAEAAPQQETRYGKEAA
jgi:hypothetical protein